MNQPSKEGYIYLMRWNGWKSPESLFAAKKALFENIFLKKPGLEISIIQKLLANASPDEIPGLSLGLSRIQAYNKVINEQASLMHNHMAFLPALYEILRQCPRRLRMRCYSRIFAEISNSLKHQSKSLETIRRIQALIPIDNREATDMLIKYKVDQLYDSVSPQPFLADLQEISEALKPHESISRPLVRLIKAFKISFTELQLRRHDHVAILTRRNCLDRQQNIYSATRSQIEDFMRADKWTYRTLVDVTVRMSGSKDSNIVPVS